MLADTASYVDPRIRMREALRTLVHAGDSWSEPTHDIFRNRLLDLTGSDARPLAELLMEALRRGWRERMHEQPLTTAAWDALVAPFIMHWSAERFVQPDMARWAVECWGYAFGVIRDDQLRIAPVRAVLAADGTRAAAPAAARAAAAPSRVPITASPPVTRHAPPRPLTNTQRNTQHFAQHNAQHPALQRTQAAVRTVGTRGVHTARSRSSVHHVNPWISRVLMAGLLTSGLALVTYVSVTANASGSSSARETPRTLGAPKSPVPAPAAKAAAPRPGVPSVTSELAGRALADSTRMLFVEPARRASGNSGLIASAPPGVAVGLDQIRLVNGTRMLGRVEVLRAGSVIFRDVTTGLRHEIVKDDVDEIVTEFGTSVRFGDASRDRASRPIPAADARTTTALPAARETGPRMRGVGGRYVIRYAAATANGSRECTSVWQRAPNTADRATVQHRAGADTLSVVFDGGDTFQSNIDRQGYFASTFRIVPDQARSSMALTTRLNGQFTNDGALAMQVNIVFFRRMRSGGDIACNVTVNAVGTRER